MATGSKELELYTFWGAEEEDKLSLELKQREKELCDFSRVWLLLNPSHYASL